MGRFKIFLFLLFVLKITNSIYAGTDSVPTGGVVGTGQRTVKILAIGNSFSEDAIEQNLYELAKAEGIELVIGNLMKGGGALEDHWRNISGDIADYSYRKIMNGIRTVSNELKTIGMVIKEEDWDYISIQQVSGYSGILASHDDLSKIMNYLRENAVNPRVKFIWHQTWAYAESSPHDHFAHYDRDQMKMYKAIADVSKRISEDEAIDMIIPSGTAIQNGRSSYIGDNFTRDGFHLDEKIGRYTAACAWFEKLFNIDVRNNTYVQPGLSDSEAQVARTAAHFAVRSPFEITSLVNIKEKRVSKNPCT